MGGAWRTQVERAWAFEVGVVCPDVTIALVVGHSLVTDGVGRRRGAARNTHVYGELLLHPVEIPWRLSRCTNMCRVNIEPTASLKVQNQFGVDARMHITKTSLSGLSLVIIRPLL